MGNKKRTAPGWHPKRFVFKGPASQERLHFYYTTFARKRKPRFSRKEMLSVGWGMLFALIGVGFLTAKLFDVIDLIEGN